MSVRGQFRKSARATVMSAFLSLATKLRTSRIGSFVPTSEVGEPLFDHLVGAIIRKQTGNPFGAARSAIFAPFRAEPQRFLWM